MRVLFRGLWVSPSYRMASYPLIASVTNGCGPQGFFSIIPDTLYGLRVTSACNPHDWDYSEGKSLKDKHRADKWFLVNLNRIINRGTKKKWLKRLRQRRAKTYYLAVSKCGGKYFMDKV